MGCGASNNIVSGITSKETIINNKYNYLKNCLDELIYNSGNKQRFVTQFCGRMYYYDDEYYSGLKQMSENGGIKSVYDIIKLLCYVPLNDGYSGCHLEMETVFKSFVIKFKKNKIEVSSAENNLRTMFYKTSHYIIWSEFKSNSEPGKYRHQEHYLKLEFKTICAIIDIVNIECNLFTNEQWISRDFINMINDFKIVKPHSKLLQKINEWIINKNKTYKFKVYETNYTITSLETRIKELKRYKECRENELNNCYNLDYNSLGNVLARGKDTIDDDISRLEHILGNQENVLKMYKKILECTESLLKIIVINSDEYGETNKSVIKQEEPVASQVSSSENTDIPIAEVVVIN